MVDLDLQEVHKSSRYWLEHKKEDFEQRALKVNEDLQEGDPSLPLLPRKDTLTYLKIVELSQAKYNL